MNVFGLAFEAFFSLETISVLQKKNIFVSGGRGFLAPHTPLYVILWELNHLQANLLGPSSVSVT